MSRYFAHSVIYMRLYAVRHSPTVSMAFNGGSAGSLQRSGFRENPTIFLTSVARSVFSGRTDAPEVRCDLTDRHTHTHRHNYSNPPAHARRVNNYMGGVDHGFTTVAVQKVKNSTSTFSTSSLTLPSQMRSFCTHGTRHHPRPKM